jgi:hypothetical protein
MKSSREPLIGQAACEADSAFRALVRMVILLDDAGIQFDDAGADVIDAVLDMAEWMGEFADRCGRAEVARRAAA